MSEFSIDRFGTRVVSQGSIIFGIKESNRNPAFRAGDSCHPFSIVFMPADPSVLRFAVAVLMLVPLVLAISRNADILPAIVESVVVYVIYHLSFFGIKNLSMHEDMFLLLSVYSTTRTLGIASILAEWIGAPLVLRKFFKIFVIDDGYVSTG